MILEAAREIPEATPQDLLAAFDYTANHYLGISGEEFLRRLDCNQLGDDDPRVNRVLRRIDLVRPNWRSK